jgi:hypothetical protein
MEEEEEEEEEDEEEEGNLTRMEDGREDVELGILGLFLS